MRPFAEGGEYDRVARVTLRWSNGREVDRTLAGTRPLGCVFGESRRHSRASASARQWRLVIEGLQSPRCAHRPARCPRFM